MEIRLALTTSVHKWKNPVGRATFGAARRDALGGLGGCVIVCIAGAVSLLKSLRFKYIQSTGRAYDRSIKKRAEGAYRGACMHVETTDALGTKHPSRLASPACAEIFLRGGCHEEMRAFKTRR